MGGDTRDENVFADEGEWWRSWWARDYSWDQLAAKPLEGFSVDKFGLHHPSGAAAEPSQQDFWCDAPLIPEPGPDGAIVRHWTPAHLPLTFETGKPAKSQWTDAEWVSMEEDLERRIRESAKKGAGVQLEGLVLRRLPSVDEEDVFYARTAFIRRIETRLECRSAFFHKTLFIDGASFDGSAFQRGASFEGALFSAAAFFRNLEFGPFAQFRHACFKANADFQHSKTYTLTLSGIRSEKTLAMNSASMDYVYIVGARLHSLRANRVKSNEINLTGAEIADSVEVKNAKITSFLAKSIDVSGTVDMENTEAGIIGMSDSRIGESAIFTNLKCRRFAVFMAMRCMGRINFKDAELGDEINFRDAVFEKAAAFNGAKWPDGDRVADAFLDTVFHRLADFRGKTPPSPAAFNGCSFRGEVKFDRLAFAQDRLFRASLRGAKHEASLESLENGCRALKLAAEAARDRLSEQHFHRYELMCRRRSWATPLSERLFSSIYGLAGDYGGSLTRPLANVAGLWLVMGLVFALWGAALASTTIPLADLFIQGIDTAGRNIFNPLGIWLRPATAPRCNPHEIESVLAWCNGPGPRLAFRLISTAQTLVAGVLIFLAGLAIKRRFQIA